MKSYLQQVNIFIIFNYRRMKGSHLLTKIIRFLSPYHLLYHLIFSLLNLRWIPIKEVEILFTVQKMNVRKYSIGIPILVYHGPFVIYNERTWFYTGSLVVISVPYPQIIFTFKPLDRSRLLVFDVNFFKRSTTHICDFKLFMT